MPDLKELLGEELHEQVKPKLGDNHLLIDKSEGEWLPKDRFNEKNDEVKDLKKQLKDRDAQLDDLKTKAAGNEELTKQINDLTEQNKTTAQEYQDKLDKQAFDFALERSLSKEKAKNPKAVKALLDTESIKLDGDKLLGLEDQLKELKESDAYLFGEGNKLGGRDPVPPKGGGGEPQKNPFKPGEINLTEQGRILREDPELAEKLKSQA
jgi:hypothetical protein